MRIGIPGSTYRYIFSALIMFLVDTPSPALHVDVNPASHLSVSIIVYCCISLYAGGGTNTPLVTSDLVRILGEQSKGNNWIY